MNGGPAPRARPHWSWQSWHGTPAPFRLFPGEARKSDPRQTNPSGCLIGTDIILSMWVSREDTLTGREPADCDGPAGSTPFVGLACLPTKSAPRLPRAPGSRQPLRSVVFVEEIALCGWYSGGLDIVFCPTRGAKHDQETNDSVRHWPDSGGRSRPVDGPRRGA